MQQFVVLRLQRGGNVVVADGFSQAASQGDHTLEYSAGGYFPDRCDGQRVRLSGYREELWSSYGNQLLSLQSGRQRSIAASIW